MCKDEWHHGVSVAVEKVNTLSFDNALIWGSKNLNDVSFLMRQGYDDYLTDYWERFNGKEKK